MQGDRSGYRALIPTAYFSRVGIGAAIRDANATEAGLDQVCGRQHPGRRNQDTLATQRAADIDNPRKLKIRLNRSTNNLLIHLTIHARIHTENGAFFLPLSLGVILVDKSAKNPISSALNALICSQPPAPHALPRNSWAYVHTSADRR